MTFTILVVCTGNISRSTPAGCARADVARADLALTAERRHRSAVLALAPEALHRAFTLRELANLAEVRPIVDLLRASSEG